MGAVIIAVISVTFFDLFLMFCLCDFSGVSDKRADADFDKYVVEHSNK